MDIYYYTMLLPSNEEYGPTFWASRDRLVTAEYISSVVGSPFERVTVELFETWYDVFFSSEAKLNLARGNVNATMLVDGFIPNGDYISGPALVTLRALEEGETPRMRFKDILPLHRLFQDAEIVPIA